MPFGLNMAQVIGRLGDDVTVNHLASGGRVANIPVTCGAYGAVEC